MTVASVPSNRDRPKLRFAPFGTLCPASCDLRLRQPAAARAHDAAMQTESERGEHHRVGVA